LQIAAYLAARVEEMRQMSTSALQVTSLSATDRAKLLFDYASAGPRRDAGHDRGERRSAEFFRRRRYEGHLAGIQEQRQTVRDGVLIAGSRRDAAIKVIRWAS
jgi:hypothetical protein